MLLHSKFHVPLFGVGYLSSEFHVSQLVLDVHEFRVLRSTTGVRYLSSEIHVSIIVVGNFSSEFYVPA